MGTPCASNEQQFLSPDRVFGLGKFGAMADGAMNM